MTKITIITPTTRPEGLPMVNDCLQRQTLTDWHWIIAGPPKTLDALKVKSDRMTMVEDPLRRPGDFYRLNGAWNKAIKVAESELLVFAVDWIWFEKDALAKFWQQYLSNKNSGVTSYGHHYRTVLGGRPEVRWCEDERFNMLARYPNHGYTGFPPVWMEMAFASLPRDKIIEAGGFDEKYDRVAGLSEKELCCRMYYQCGTQFVFADGEDGAPDIEIRNFSHKKDYGRSWDDAYADAEAMFTKDLEAIRAGERKLEPMK